MAIETSPDNKFYQWVCNVYSELANRATKNREDELVFTGSYVLLYNSLGVPRTYYTPIRKLLTSPDHDPCITIYQRGSRYQDSVIRLHHAPPEEWATISFRDLTGPREAARVVADTETRLRSVEGWRETFKGVNVANVMIDFEKRLTKLEVQVAELVSTRREG